MPKPKKKKKKKIRKYTKEEINQSVEWVRAALYYLMGPSQSGGRPYLAAHLQALALIPRPGIETAAIDSSYRMYFEPSFVTDNVQGVAAIIEHEIWHILKRHHRRAEAMGITRKNATAWNYAADAEIHNDPSLVERVMLLDTKPVTAASMGWPEGLLAEQYYELIPEGEDPGGGGGGGGGTPDDDDEDGEGGYGPGRIPDDDDDEDEDGGGGGGEVDEDGDYEGDDEPDVGGGNCGEVATGIPTDWQDPPDNRISRTREDAMNKTAAKKIIEQSAMKPGSISEEAKEWAETTLAPPKVKWENELRSAVKKAVAWAQGNSEYSRSRMSRRQAYSDFIRPGLVHPVPEIAIVLDRSGSMQQAGGEPAPGVDTLYDRAKAELEAIVKIYGPHVGVAVYAVDTEVVAAKRVFGSKQFKAPIPGGGTDMGPGIKAAYHGKPKPHVIVVLTDGELYWPDTPPPGVKMVIGLVGVSREMAEQNEFVAGPPWGKKVYIHD